MQIYLDTCSLQRPLDDKSQARIALEAESILSILTLWEAATITLVSSEILQFEIDQISQPQRKAFVSAILDRIQTTVMLTDEVTQRAKKLEQYGLKALNALHVAIAEAAQVDYFCTCDDRLLKRIKTTPNLSLRVVSPLELAQELLP
jgi:predicted nucleic acid-binding protein